MKNACKICNHATSPIIHHKFGTYDFCPNCEFISKQELFYLTEALEKQEYDLHQNSFDDEKYVAYFEDFIGKSILNYASIGRKGFDFGSGPEPVLAQVLEQNHHYDMDHYDYYYAPEPVHLNKLYDLITATEVFEHLSKPLDHLKTLMLGLEPRGVLALMTTFHPNDKTLFMNWHYMRDYTHISFFTVKTLTLMAQVVGLKLIYTDNKRYATFIKA